MSCLVGIRVGHLTNHSTRAYRVPPGVLGLGLPLAPRLDGTGPTGIVAASCTLSGTSLLIPPGFQKIIGRVTARNPKNIAPRLANIGVGRGHRSRDGNPTSSRGSCAWPWRPDSRQTPGRGRRCAVTWRYQVSGRDYQPRCPTLPYLSGHETQDRTHRYPGRAGADREDRRLAQPAPAAADPQCGDRAHDRRLPGARSAAFGPSLEAVFGQPGLAC